MFATEVQMTQRQVITVGADGSLQGLQHKPGKGLDLRQFGPAHIVRATEVLWHETDQGWFVEFRSGPLTGELLDAGHVKAAGMDYESPPFPVKQNVYAAFGRNAAEDEPVLLFAEYDDAVKAEIAVLDGLRLNGVY